jgi:hypothetical protein
MREGGSACALSTCARLVGVTQAIRGRIVPYRKLRGTRAE